MQDLNIKKISDAVAKVTAESLADKVFEEEVTKLVEKTDSCKSQVTGFDTFKPSLDTAWKNKVVGIDTSIMKNWKPVTESFQALAVKNVPTMVSLSQRVNINYGINPQVQRSVNAMVSTYNKRFTTIASQVIEKINAAFPKSRIEAINSSLSVSLRKLAKYAEYLQFLNIADVMNFPIYLENGGELQRLLLESYHKNGDTCNKEEMTQIIMDYYDDDYAWRVFNSIYSVGTFGKYNDGRMRCLKEGFVLYELGYYYGAGAIFADQISGMIEDIYNDMLEFHQISNKEKKEILDFYNQHCKEDSEKGMLLQAICCQPSGFMVWDRIAKYFLRVLYSSKDTYVETNPQRHPICHGRQTNYDTKEMNLKLIMSLDILAELAWRIQDMKAEKKSA